MKVGFDFTQAQFRVEAPVHVAELLEALLRERRKAVGLPALARPGEPRRAASHM